MRLRRRKRSRGTQDPVHRPNSQSAPTRAVTAEEFEQAPVERPDRSKDAAARAAAQHRMQRKHEWVDLQIQEAMARGDFDDLPGAGKPIPDLGSAHDGDWWLKKLIEREQITGVLPAALQLRKDDVTLDDELDREVREERVRETVADFNRRIIEARRQLLGGPPVITRVRDVDTEVRRWRERRGR